MTMYWQQVLTKCERKENEQKVNIPDVRANMQRDIKKSA